MELHAGTLILAHDILHRRVRPPASWPNSLLLVELEEVFESGGRGSQSVEFLGWKFVDQNAKSLGAGAVTGPDVASPTGGNGGQHRTRLSVGSARLLDEILTAQSAARGRSSKAESHPRQRPGR